MISDHAIEVIISKIIKARVRETAERNLAEGYETALKDAGIELEFTESGVIWKRKSGG